MTGVQTCALPIYLPCGIPVTAVIDRLELDGWKATVCDYKTQKDPFTQEELDLNWQAMIYFIAALSEIPLAKSEPLLETCFWVLRHDRQRVFFSTAQEKVILDRIDAKVLEILSDPCTDTRPSGLCRFCPVEGCHGKNITRTFSRAQKSASVKEYRKLLDDIRARKSTRKCDTASTVVESIEIF